MKTLTNPKIPIPMNTTRTFSRYLLLLLGLLLCVSGKAQYSAHIMGNQQLLSGELADSIRITTTAYMGCGSPVNRWQQSTDGGHTWQTLSAGGSAAYAPGVLAQTTRYRLYSSCAGQPALDRYSNEVSVVVLSKPAAPVAEELALSFDKNYILAYTPQQPCTDAAELPVEQRGAQVIYYDGLGRPLQQVQPLASPWLEDVVTPISYDPYGRQDKDYLPYALYGGKGSYQPAAFNAQPAWYAERYTADEGAAAFSRRRYEPSPLNRVVEELLPGSGAYATTATLRHGYGSNGADEVKLWQPDGTVTGYYAPGTLYKEKDTTPDGRVSLRYTDLQGRLIEEQQLGWDGPLVTSYAYDAWGRLRLVVPPKAQTVTPEWSSLVYRYTYDHRGRCIEKKLPDAQHAYYVYDAADRLVVSQDGYQRTYDQWLHYRYDRLGRQVATCIRRENISVNNLRGYYINSVQVEEYDPSQLYGYALSGLDKTQLLSLSYYDRYNRTPHPEPAVAQAYAQPTGSLTGSISFRLDYGGGQVETAYYYNHLGRLVAQRSLTENNGYDWQTTAYTFTGQPLEQHRTFSLTGTESHVERYLYTYDHAGRLQKLWHGLDNMANRLLATYSYDELGRQRQKQQGNGLETVRSTYDLRNRLTSLVGTSFRQWLGYEAPLDRSGSPYYGGDISTIHWQQQGKAVQLGRFDYDPHGRLSFYDMAGRHGKGSYDPNGNPIDMSITHPDLGNATYWGNWLSGIWREDGSLQYSFGYDGNGNMGYDGLTDSYTYFNLLNLPERISKDSESVMYGYTADGQKREKRYNNAPTQYYRGSVVYKTDGTPDYVLHPEGMARYLGNRQWAWQYNLTDHLGNVRAVKAENGAILQQTDYYPFGQAISLNNLDKNAYLYGGKEYQGETLGGVALNQYDHGARFNSPMFGRFTTRDPLMEKYYGVSPYVYCANNPLRYVDPDGREVITDLIPWRCVWTVLRVKEQLTGWAEEQQAAAQRLATGQSGAANVPSGDDATGIASNVNKAMGTLNDVGTVAEGVVDVATAVGSIPGFDMILDPLMAMAYGGAGDVENAVPYSLAVIIPGVSGGPTKVGFKTLSELGVKDGMKVSSSAALDLGEQFLGKGYKELESGSGRYVSGDGARVFRMGVSDITGAHGGGPHVNFETLVPNPNKPGKMMVDKNVHVYITK